VRTYRKVIPRVEVLLPYRGFKLVHNTMQAARWHNRAYPRGAYRFANREFLIVSYRTDPDALRGSLKS
jgi:acetoacetate decarboxylase